MVLFAYQHLLEMELRIFFILWNLKIKLNQIVTLYFSDSIREDFMYLLGWAQLYVSPLECLLKLGFRILEMTQTPSLH